MVFCNVAFITLDIASIAERDNWPTNQQAFCNHVLSKNINPTRMASLVAKSQQDTSLWINCPFYTDFCREHYENCRKQQVALQVNGHLGGQKKPTADWLIFLNGENWLIRKWKRSTKYKKKTTANPEELPLDLQIN